jgi:serralysin
VNGSTNVDRITDFKVGEDTVCLDNAVFTVLPLGGLDAAAFAIAIAAHDANDRVIYNPTTGALLYDADGIGGAAGTKFATLSTGLALSNGDFRVI